jgi:hypothetical protein
MMENTRITYTTAAVARYDRIAHAIIAEHVALAHLNSALRTYEHTPICPACEEGDHNNADSHALFMCACDTCRKGN